ncbi:MAG: substrate-binding domain-containing protein [Anaerolineales bacterium]|nr:substrate-binding domain-containing protein [Anaerolineales bacterium]MDW8277079.1 substrate-binding domain-containing protein [Anaerolineales bacterium]
MPQQESAEKRRKTVGVFVSQVGRVWGADYMAAITDTARARDVNLICFVGGRPTAVTTPGHLSPSYGLYDLAKTADLDGLILAADLGHGVSGEEIRQFAQHFSTFPLTSTALEVEHTPNLMVDSVGGMRLLIRHLIETHGYRRIAFIRGPKGQIEAEQRLFAYREELKAHGIEYDEKLVTSGDYSVESGRAAIKKLVEDRKMKFQAVAAANDRMAFGAMEALRGYGMNIPTDVAVTGFDDVREARSLGVPLTTVRQPFYDLGKNTFETLLKVIDGDTEPTLTTIPTSLVVRWSCGCQPRFIQQAHISREEVARTGTLENKQDACMRAMFEASGVPMPSKPALLKAYAPIWENFLFAMREERPAESFLSAIEQAILTLQKYNDDPGDWHNVLSVFRRHALAGIIHKDATLQAENLFQQARMLIGELSQRHQAYQRLELEQEEQILQSFSFDMAPAMSLQEIGAAIQKNFPSMGVERLYVMFYDRIARPQSALIPPSQSHQLFLQYENGRCELFTEQPKLATGHLIPRASIPTDRRYTAVVMPLALAQSRFGFMWIETKADNWEVCVRVRNLLSSALLRIMLVEQREAAQREVERLLYEAKQRAEELDRLYQQEQERRREADALAKAARNLSSVISVEALPAKILEQLATVMPYERGALLMEEFDGTVSLMAHRGFPDDRRADELRIQINPGGVYDQIARSGEVKVVDDVTQEPGWFQVEWLPVHHSWVGIPLFAKNRVVGMLSLTRVPKAAFTADDLLLASTFAMQASIALQNARLYDEQARFNEIMEHAVEARVAELHDALNTLEKLNKNKTSFIQVAAHELRTPLTVMKGYLGILKGHSALQEQEALLQALDGVMKGTDRLHQVINAMLDVAKLDSQAITPHMEPTIIGLVLQLVQKEYKNDLKERNITLTVESSVSQLPQILADPQLLQKALDAVVVNAIKFTPDGGKITISGEVVQDEPRGEWVEIRVADTGIGIDPANHKVIFEKMYQIGKVELHSSGRTKFKGGGPGLGLAIAQGIIKAHDGKIWVESPGYDEEKLPGSTFFIRLPLRKPA